MQDNNEVWQPPTNYHKSALECHVPLFVKVSIGYEGWEWMSWALHHGYVQDHKYFLSQKAGHDVGVPATATSLIYARVDNLSKVLEETRATLKNIEQLMTVGYLLGTDYVSPIWVRRPKDPQNKWIQTGIVPDEHGTNQLEGELRRWKNHRGGTPRDNFALFSEDVDAYCENYNLYISGFDTVNQIKKKLCTEYE